MNCLENHNIKKYQNSKYKIWGILYDLDYKNNYDSCCPIDLDKYEKRKLAWN